MIFKLIITFFISFYVTNMPYMFEEEGIYQINNLKYSYTNGYGINQDETYEIECDDSCVLTYKEYGKDDDYLININLTKTNMEKFVSILNKNHVLSWKGFHKSDNNVLDGDSFNFSLRYNDDEKLSASGYMMYPDNYKNFSLEFKNYVNEIIK